MSSPTTALRLFPAFLFTLATVAATAAPKLDLERVTPVPADQPIPTQDFFRPRLLSQPTLNSSGTHIAAVIAYGEDKHRLLVYNIDTQVSESVGGSGEKDVYAVYWLNNSRLIFSLASRKYFGIGLIAAEVGSLREGYAVQQYCSSRLVSVPLKNPLRPLVWNRSDIETDQDNGVVAINTNIKSGEIVDLTASSATRKHFLVARENNQYHVAQNYPLPPSGMTYGYIADKAGELAYCLTTQDGSDTLFRLVGKKWVKCPVDLRTNQIVGTGNESGWLLVCGPRQEGKPRALQLLNPATGELGAVVLQDQGYDFEGSFYRSPTTGDVLGIYYQRNGPRVYWLDEEFRALQKTLEGMFPGLVIRIYGNDIKNKVFLIAAFSDRQPAIYRFVNLETRTTGIFQSSAPWIDPQRMQPMNILKFKTRDGHQLDAYLTLPAGASKTNQIPLVVLPHGGPWGVRDTWGFDGEVQFLASHGYAVLQPNFRGTIGYNWMFPEEDAYDFSKMHNDVTDSVQAAINTGMIDKDRVGIMGGSFGGYLAVSGVAHEPDLYRCAVTNAGVFDWAMQVQSEKYNQFDLPNYDYFINRLGDPKKQPEKFAAMSPINFVDKIRVPVFVAGGKDDQTVEIQQSKKLVSALEKYNVPYEKLFIGGEGHGMAYLKNEVELYDRILAFLDKNLMPKK